MTRFRHVLKWVLTIILLGLGLALALWKRDTWDTMSLNDWGGFTGGIFAPIAFLWFVFAYYQQAEELRQNTKALNLQAKELKNQVAESRRMAKAAIQQAKANKALADLAVSERKEERDRRSRLRLVQAQYHEHSPTHLETRFKNVGGAAIVNEVDFPAHPSLNFHLEPLPRIEAGQEVRVQFQAGEPGTLQAGLAAAVVYTNEFDERCQVTFVLEGSDPLIVPRDTTEG